MEVMLHSVKPEKALLKGQDECGLEMCFLSVIVPVENGVDRAN